MHDFCGVVHHRLNIDNTKKICLKLQEMLSFGSPFQIFLGEHTTGTHPIVRKCQITKSQAFETKNYGHPETIIGRINFKRYTH